MAEMNEIFTRLQLKHDTYANWMAVQDTFKPLAGEICIVEIPSTNSATTTTPPTVLFKVGMYKKDAQGNDTTELYTFKELNWGSALAADVYSWAKCREVELDGDIIKFHNGDKNNPIHTIDLSNYVDTGEFARTLDQYKVLQDAVTDPAANGKSLTFIDTISQDTQGVITATKKSVNLDAYALKADLGDVSTLTTTAKTAVGAINEHDTEIGDLTKLSTANKGDLVTAINEVRQAVEVGGTGSVVTVRKADDNTYRVQQGGKDVDVAIELGNGAFTVTGEDGLEGSGSMTANQSGDTSATIKHSVPTGAEEGEHSAIGELVYEVTTDKFGHTTGVTTTNLYTYGEGDSRKEGSGVQIQLNTSKDAASTGAYVQYEGIEGINVKAEFLNGHAKLTIDGADLKTYTDEKVAAAIAGAVDFLGVVNDADALSAAQAEATHGDFVRVGTAFGDYHVADLLVWNKPENGTGAWVVIHGEEGDIVEVKAGDGLTGGAASGIATIGLSDATKASLGNADTAYSWGDHAQEGYLKAGDIANKADKVTSATAGNFAGLDADGNLTDSGYNAESFATPEQGEKADTAIQNLMTSGGLGHAVEIELKKTAIPNDDGDYQVVNIQADVVENGIKTQHIADANVTAAKLAEDVKEFVKTEAATLDAVVLAESQKYTDDAIGDLHAIATSGSIYDIAEGHNVSTGADGVKYLIFNCGSATTVI